MKSVISLLCAMFFLATGIQAQKKLTEGTIIYDIVIHSNSDQPRNADYLDGTTVANYIKGNKSRTDMVNALGTMITIHDSSKNIIAIIKEFGEQKYITMLTQDDWKDANKKFEGISYDLSDTATKTIQGYTCRKATGHLQDGTTYTVWYTPDLIPQNRNFQYETRTLPGLAMEYEVDSKGRKITYTVSRISFSPVPSSKFELPKSGYRVITYAESKGQ